MHKPGLVAPLATRPSPRSSCLDPSAGKRWLPTSRTTGNGCAGYQAPPSYDQHTGRARRGRAGAALCRASRPEGGIQRTVSAAPAVVRAEASRRARVALLSAWGISVGHQGGAERENRIPEPATEPPPAGFGPGGARGVLGATEIVVQDLYRFYPSLTPSNTLLGRVMCRSTILVRALSACPDCPRGEACSDQVEALWSRRGPCRLKPRVPPTQCE